MSYQLCQDCQSNRFDLVDGRLFCAVCQSQNVSLQIHVSFANEGANFLGRRTHDQTGNRSFYDETVPKIEIIKENEKFVPSTLRRSIDGSSIHSEGMQSDDSERSRLEKHIWTSYEIYSYILNIQLTAIAELKSIKEEKRQELFECTFLLYLRYLSSNGILRANQNRLTPRQEERRLKVNQILQILYNNRFETFQHTNRHTQNRSLCCVNLDILLSLIHCSSMLIGCPITLRQLIDWINTNRLPYYNIHKYLPSWTKVTGRDRFSMEKMKIRSESLFLYHKNFIRPLMKSYIERALSRTNDEFRRILVEFIRVVCDEIYFPFDDLTRPIFESFADLMTHKDRQRAHRFCSSSFDFEMTSLVIIILMILLHLINDHRLDEFVQNEIVDDHSRPFSYSLWIRTLEILNDVRSRRDRQFFGRCSILVNSISDNHSKIRYQTSLSKVFHQNVNEHRDEALQQIDQEIRRLEQVLKLNSQNHSLMFAIRSEEYFRKRFHQDSTECLSSFFEKIVHKYSPKHYSAHEKSELYETCLSLINGATITQIEDLFLLRQRLDLSSSSRFSLQHLLSTLCQSSAIPYNEQFHGFFSRFLKKFVFNQRLHHYFLQRPSTKRLFVSTTSNKLGMKNYGVDQFPILVDLKTEQQRSISNLPIG